MSDTQRPVIGGDPAEFRKASGVTQEEFLAAWRRGEAQVTPGDITDPDLPWLTAQVEAGTMHGHDALWEVGVQWSQQHVDGVTPDVRDPEFLKLLAVAGTKAALEGSKALAEFAGMVAKLATLAKLLGF